MGFSDEEIILFIVNWRSDWRAIGLLVVFFLILSYINYKLCMQIRRDWKSAQTANDIIINWTQNLNEVEIDFPLPTGATSKDVECRITSTTLHFAFKTEKNVELDVRIHCPINEST